jgi:hypothetical protein
MRSPAALSRHLLLELEAAQAGRALAPGAPVPRCGCVDCTGIPDPTRPRRPDSHRHLDVAAARAAPILDVAARFGLTHRRGWARCPFHDDAHPSFHLNARKNRAFCNVCGRSWDTIALTMELGRLTFPEAVKELAA